MSHRPPLPTRPGGYGSGSTGGGGTAAPRPRHPYDNDYSREHDDTRRRDPRRHRDDPYAARGGSSGGNARRSRSPDGRGYDRDRERDRRNQRDNRSHSHSQGGGGYREYSREQESYRDHRGPPLPRDAYPMREETRYIPPPREERDRRDERGEDRYAQREKERQRDHRGERSEYRERDSRGAPSVTTAAASRGDPRREGAPASSSRPKEDAHSAHEQTAASAATEEKPADGMEAVADGDGDANAEEQAMMAAMGFGGFGTTKNHKVEGNDTGAAFIKKERTWRQYMNRKGGFNRQLDALPKKS